ncbi:MAG: phosphoserine phosphatase [Cellvibrionaceae bacterium]|jgi:phosphoserine phosphatase
MRWPSFQYIFFDCDSTLSTIEGIDVLAESADKKWRVEVLTNAAMNGDLDLSEVYGKRLRAVRPTRQQVHEIKNAYKKTIVEDAAEVIAALQHFGVEVFVISGGLLEPVREFAISLGVPADNIRAVDVQYDSLSDEWWQQSDGQKVRYKTFEDGALTITDGKADIVEEMLKSRPPGRSLLIGDGTSDMMAGRRVDLFVGFGGVIKREKVFNGSPVFLHTESLAPLLALALGPRSLAFFNGTKFEPLIKKGALLIENGAYTFKDTDLEKKFNSASLNRPS